MSPYLFWFKYFVYINDKDFAHDNYLFTKALEFIGEEFKDEIPGKQSHLRKGERKLIQMLKQQSPSVNISVTEVKSLFGSRSSIIRGTHLRIPYTINVIFEVMQSLFAGHPNLRQRLCDLLRQMDGYNQRIYRDILLKEFYFAMNQYQSQLNGDYKAMNAFMGLRSNTQSLLCS